MPFKEKHLKFKAINGVYIKRMNKIYYANSIQKN